MPKIGAAAVGGDFNSRLGRLSPRYDLADLQVLAPKWRPEFQPSGQTCLQLKRMDLGSNNFEASVGIATIKLIETPKINRHKRSAVR